MIILGIDPGYATLGWGCVSYEHSRFSLIDFGTIRTSPDTDFPSRLISIYTEIEILIAKHRPDCMAIEKLYFKNNQKTAIDVAQARGVILLTAKQSGIEIYEYTPLQVKSAVTGYGKAQKPQVMEMTRRLLKLREIPRPDDAADALAISVCHAQTCGTPLKKMIFKMS